mgnify:CR=1 FL=1
MACLTAFPELAIGERPTISDNRTTDRVRRDAR